MASNGQPVAQTTRLQQTSVSLYVGAGATGGFYNFNQGGQFVDSGFSGCDGIDLTGVSALVQPRAPARTTPLYQGGPQTSSGAGRIATGLTAVPR